MTSIIPLNKQFQASVKDKDIIGIGEYSHGSLKSLQTRIDITKFLIEHHNYSVLLMEADINSIQYLNYFIKGNSSDTLQAINSIGYWWNTDEMGSFILWLRNYNVNNDYVIEIHGIDFQIPWNSLGELENSWRDNQDLINIAQKLKEGFISLEQNGNNKELIKILKKTLDNLLQVESDSADQQNLRKLEAILKLKQMNRFQGYKFREQQMFENLTAVTHGPAILWAHNDHIAKSKNFSLGKMISKNYGDEYLTIGTTAYGGKIAGFSKDLSGYTFSTENVLKTPTENTFEFYLKKEYKSDALISVPIFLTSNILKDKLGFRSIGAFVPENPQYQFLPSFSLNENFDYLIFILDDKASKLRMMKDQND